MTSNPSSDDATRRPETTKQEKLSVMRFNLHTSALLIASLLASAGCAPKNVEDDANYTDARQIIVDMTTEDSLDVASEDRVDWKRVVPMDEGEVTLRLLVGDPFKGAHGLTGVAIVYTARAEEITREQIVPSQNKYELKFEGKPNVQYLVKVEAATGKAPYKFDYSQTVKPKDPCAMISCQEGQRCEDGQCVAEEEEEEEEEVTEACPGGCRSGYYCSKRYKKCLKRRKATKRTTKRRTPKRTPKRTTKKEDKKEEPKAASNTGPISARVIQVIPGGGTTTLLLNRGKKHNVKVGDTGTAGGVSFKIIAAYAFRSKARATAAAAKLSSVKSATINRK